MAKALTLDQAGRALLWFLLSTALVVIGPQYAGHLIFDPHATDAIRYLGVALSVLSLVPFLAYAAWGLSIADEYHRQTLVVGTAVSFALAILFSIATQLMADARLIEYQLTLNLPIGGLLWIVGVGATALYFKARARG